MVTRTKRIDAIGRRYIEQERVLVEGSAHHAEETWAELAMEEIEPGFWSNGNTDVTACRQADMELEYEIHPSPRAA
jgi:hypothetical protein